MTRTRTDRWHNTGGNGPAEAVWCRSRKGRSAVVQVYRSHDLHAAKTCVLERWENFKQTAVAISGLSFKTAKRLGDEFLGVKPRKSRAGLKKFSVVGFYVDNNQPLISWETCLTPQEAAQKAKYRRDSEVKVVEVLHGHRKGILTNDEVL